MAYAHTDQGDIVLRLDTTEAVFLRAAMNKVSGDFMKLRGHADEIEEALAKVEVPRKRIALAQDPFFADTHRGIYADRYQD